MPLLSRVVQPDPGVDGVVQFRFGAGVPSNALGNDGDAYFDNLNGDYYSKIAGVWVFQFNASGSSAYGLLGANYNTTIPTSVISTTPTLIPFDTTVFEDAPITKTSNTLFTINPVSNVFSCIGALGLNCISFVIS